MKRKLLFMAVGLILGLSQANAYTTENLVSDGWSLVSSLSDNKDNVYVFVDAGSENYVLSGYAVKNPFEEWNTASYKTLESPITTPLEVWTIETRNNGYALRNIISQDYFNSNAGGSGEGWRTKLDSDYANGSFTFNLADGKYSITGVSSGQLVGPWNNDGSVKSDGEEVAANKTAEQAPGFKIYKMAKATYALKYMQNTPNLSAPLDVSYLIENPTIYQANDNNKMPAGWSDYDVNSDARTSDGAGTNTKLKIWDKGTLGIGSGKGDYFTTIGSLPNGKYRVTAGIRGNGGDASKFKAYIFQESTDTRAESPSAPNGSIADRTTDYLTINSGTANIGVHTTSTVGTTTLEADNFRMEVDPYLSTIATAEFTSGSTLTAGLWYYFDIASAYEYDFTSSEAITLSYATGAKTLGEASTVTFTADETKALDLEAGRLYLKADVATTLTLTYRYDVGSATLSNANGSYIQSSTFSVTYPDATTNDPSASAALVASSKATVNGNAVALSEITNGFSLDLGSLTGSTDYHIVIPAGVYGYDGESMNAAIDVTLHTPAVFDGYYFMKTSGTKYVSRGGDYNSRAIVDEFGLPLNVATNASTGITQFTYVDNGGKLFLNEYGNAYTDAASPADWTVEPTTGGFYIIHANDGDYKNKKLNVWTGDGKSMYATTDEGVVFEFEPVDEHNIHMEALKDAQAATAATAAGIVAADKSELATVLDANYNAVPVVVPTVEFTEKWNDKASAEWDAGKDMYTNTITSLPEGLYKLTVNAFYRINGSATAAEGARGNTYLYGGSAKTQLYSLKDFPAADAWPGRNQSDTDGYYPDDVESGTAATASSYLTELYVYHAGGDFTYGIHQPSRFSNGEWFGYQKFTLTRYEQTEATMYISDAKYATFIAPFDVTIPSGVDAYKILTATGSTLNLTSVETTIPANTPVVLYSESIVNETFKGKDNSVEDAYTVGLLTGVYEATAAPVGSYVLQKNDEKVGFYQVVDGKQPTVGANRAYMDAAAPGVKAFYFDEGTATAIQNVFSGVAEGEIYDIAGRKVSKMQKGGVYVVNGQKVIIK